MTAYDDWLKRLNDLSNKLTADARAISDDAKTLTGLIAEFPESAPGPTPEPPTPELPTPEPTGKLPIYLDGPTSLSASVMAAYNCKKNYHIYQSVLDPDKNAVWNGRTAAWTGAINNIPQASTVPVCLDWENWPAVPSGFYGALSGQFGTAAQQKQAMTEALKALNAAKQDRPNSKCGYYDMPLHGPFSAVLNNSDSWAAQEIFCHDLWVASEVITTSAYCHLQKGSSTSTSGGTITQADLQKFQSNLVTLALKCAANGGGKALVMPFVSYQYYAYNHSLAYDDKLVPADWIYQHVYYACRANVGGKGVGACQIWSKAAGPAMTEPILSAIYQGANGISPFNPNMARPS